MFRKYDVQFESERLESLLPVIAKREQTEKLYKPENHFMIHMLYKLTDIHLAPVTQCAMILSLASQVMSHTVAAGIFALLSYGKEQYLH